MPADLLFKPTPHKEAAAFIASKPVVSREVFDGLLPELRARAFVISGVEAANVVQGIRDRIADLPQGANWDDVKRDLVEDLHPFLRSDDDPENTIAAERRAELLIRMHGFQAYQASAWQVMDRQRDVFPFWQYHSMGDDHVRPTHEALDGVVLPCDHEFWKTHFPPWEFGCRCQVIPISQADKEELEKRDEKRDPDHRDVLDDDAQKELSTSRRLVRNGVTYNMTAPSEQGKPGAFQWHPGDLRLSVEDLKKRYDAQMWQTFQTWAKGTRIDGINKTVWSWIGGSTEWPDLSELTVVKKLGGSTGAELVRDSGGRMFVRKRGAGAEHLEEEFAADQAYLAAGINVPKAKLYTTPQGPVKLAQFVEGTVLKDYLSKATAEQAALAIGKIQSGFVADALFANYDTVGLDLDNMLIDKSGQVWRIDNGGSFRFRARGGAKTGWGPKVTELQTMRDAKINPSAARIFGGVTDAEIRRQIGDLSGKRESILAAVPHALRDTLAQRIDSLEAMLKPAGDDFAQKVVESRVVGKVSKRDRLDIEDTQVLLWQETGASGSQVTRAKFKLTESGSQKVMERLAASMPAAPASVTAPAADAYWKKIEDAIKTVNTHAGDSNYNPGTMNTLAAVKADLEKLTGKAALKKHYLAVIDEIEKAKAAKAKTPILKPYEPKAKPAPAPTAREFNIDRRHVEYFSKTTERGHASEEGNAIYKHDAYLIDMGGTKIKLVPFKEPNGADFNAPYALRGYVEVLHPQGASETSIGDILDHLSKIGIDTTPATDAYGEQLYLRKGMQIRTDVFTPAKLSAADAILTDTAKNDVEKVTALKAMAEKELGIKLPDRITPDYDPRGHANAFDQGWMRTDRWDLPRSKVEKEMKDYKLWHETRAPIHQLVDSILNGGGDFTCTTERLRKGIDIKAGKSPDADLNTGGANYLFTRIRPKSKTDAGINFKIGLLSRQDAFSFNHDRFGNVKDASAYSARGKTISDFKAYSKPTGNETIFKWGIPFLDEVDTIVCRTPAERQAVLDVFARHGYDQLPDGRKIKDIVK